MKKPVIGVCRVPDGNHVFVEESLARYNSRLEKRSEDFGFAVWAMTPADIRDYGALDNPDVVGLFLPGAREGKQYRKLGAAGYAAVQRFVANGGAVTGICAGAYMIGNRVFYKDHESVIESDETMKLVPADMHGLIEELLPEYDPYIGLGTAEIAGITVHTHGGDHKGELLYWRGPRIVQLPGGTLKTLATFDIPGEPHGEKVIAAASARYGKGTATALAIHAEISGHGLRTIKGIESLDRGNDARRLRFCDTLSANGAVRECLFNLAMRPMVVGAVNLINRSLVQA